MNGTFTSYDLVRTVPEWRKFALAGACINDVTDEQFVGELTGTAALSGRVKVCAVQSAVV
jgi:hypothetical protein